MFTPDTNPTFPPSALDETRLQQELRSLFTLDTQNYLQKYSQIAERLQFHTWSSDIQELYRCIHTIKGGAVTVAAESILQVATALEDLLSDLRYLEAAPPLEDGYLRQALSEAGELLSGAVTLSAAPGSSIDPLLHRIRMLHDQIRTQYFPQWTDQRRLYQDFAEQGFDLVVLELEIALEQLPAAEPIPSGVMAIAQQVLQQLRQIGQDLQMAAGWSDLLDQAETLLTDPASEIWRSQWPHWSQRLKHCAKQGGESLSEDILQALEAAPVLCPDRSIALAAEAEAFVVVDPIATLSSPDDVSALTVADSEIGPELEPIADFTLLDVADFLDALAPDAIAESAAAVNLEPLLSEAIEPLNRLTPELEYPNTDAETVQIPVPLEQLDQSAQALKTDAETVQIPVPLERLDQSAQYLVESLLAFRATRDCFETLRQQVAQLTSLAQEGTQHIAHLRQLQDDYALLDHLNHREQGPLLERYRQGYTTLNRVLETSLRLSELGAEAEKNAQKTLSSLRALDSNLLRLQNTVEDSRLVPFQNLAFRARAVVRDLVTRYGKPAQLLVEGEQLELDVSTARILEPALLHLIRNAFDHGLESPSARLAQGKPEQGNIILSLQRYGDSFLLSIKDDGWGIDAAAIQARAEVLNLPLTNTQTPEDLLAVICQPGFSSETEISEISGRGVGMDVVAAQVAQLGGRLSLETALNQGTQFRLQFSVSHLLVACVLLRTDRLTVAIPAEAISRTYLLEQLQITSTPGGNSAWTVHTEEGAIAAFDLLTYWQPNSPHRELDKTAVAVLVRSPTSPRRIWLFADELVGQTDLLINPLPAPLVAPEGMLGVSLQPDGSLVPVLEAASLNERLLNRPLAIAPSVLDEPEPASTGPVILVVDDAVLMRRRLEASLTAYGYDVHTCADGLEAWNWLQANPHPTLVITDIEMPQMDGFTLIDRCRQHGMTTPILVISSRLSEEWFNEARRLGATDYLTKGFSTLELMNKVNALSMGAMHLPPPSPNSGGLPIQSPPSLGS